MKSFIANELNMFAAHYYRHDYRELIENLGFKKESVDVMINCAVRESRRWERP